MKEKGSQRVYKGDNRQPQMLVETRTKILEIPEAEWEINCIYNDPYPSALKHWRGSWP